jgi:hypothetical protein
MVSTRGLGVGVGDGIGVAVGSGVAVEGTVVGAGVAVGVTLQAANSKQIISMHNLGKCFIDCLP